MKSIKNFILFLLLTPACLVIPGCGRNVYLSDNGYNPGAPVKNIKEYKDVQIYLGSFNNNAPNTRSYKYYSPDNSVSYSTSSLVPDYVYYCFKKAFTEIGMKVNELDEAPVIYLMINEIYGTGMKFDINLYRGDDLEYVKELAVTVPAVTGTTAVDPALLERNAYNMIDAAVALVLNDKEFKNKLIKKPADIEKKIEGTPVGIVKAVDVPANEIIVSSGKIASMVNIGDIIYIVINGVKISLEVNFPMQTIAKCKIIEKDRKNLTKLKNGDMVYK